MKFSFASISMLAMTPLAVMGLRATDVEPAVELTKFTVVPSFPDSAGAAVSEMINDNKTPVEFKFENRENFPVQVAAFGGSFTYKGKDTPYKNLTTAKVGPILIESNGFHTLTTDLKVTLPPQDFDLVFTLLLAFEGGMSAFDVDPISVTVSDPPISILDPKLLLANLILCLTVIGVSYWGVTAFALPYFEEKKQAAPKKVVEAEPQASGVVPGEKGYDESWIPQHHLNAGKKPRKTKP